MNLLRTILTLLLYFFCSNVYAQDLELLEKERNILVLEKKEYNEAILLNYEIRNLCKANPNKIENYGTTFSSNVYCQYQLKNPYLQMYIDSALQLGQQYNVTMASDFYPTIWSIQGNVFFNKGYYEKAILTHQKILDLDIDWLSKNKKNLKVREYVGIDYQNIGAAYTEMKDGKHALDYYRYAIPYLKHDKYEYANTINNIARSYELLGEEQLAKDTFYQAIQIIDNPSNKEEDLLLLTISINYCQDSLPCLEVLSKKAKRLKDNIILARIYQLQANILYEDSHYSKAKTLSEKALQLRHQEYGAKHHEVAISHKRLGIIADSVGNYNQALLYYQKALTTLVWDFNDSTDITKNTTLEQQISSKVELLETLRNKANDLKLLNELPLALETYELLFDLIDDMRLNYIGDLSIYHLLKEASPIYEAAIETALALEEKEKVFEFIARSKSVLLLEGIRDLQAKNRTQIPSNLLDKERALKIDIAYYERELFQAKRKKQSEKIEQFQKLHFERQQEYLTFLEALENDYPNYYQRKYNTEVADIASLRKHALDEQSALLEFFQGEKHTYTVLLTKEEFEIYTLPKSKTASQIAALRTALAKPIAKKAAFQAFTENAYALYQQLLQPLEIPSSVQKLILVTDKQLGYIPFQSLIKHPAKETYKEARYDTLSYLIQDYQFSYAYASTLLVESAEQPCKADARIFGGFAPLFNNAPSLMRNGQELGELVASYEEVAEISTILNGVIYTGKEATKENFLDHVSDYKILHLATHANLNDIEPMESEIHFIDTSLTTREIYNLPLCAELAVLSACETGTGELKKGEGIMSLARAFAQAGCPSLVASLWQVNDKQTSKIMSNFYTSLHEGDGKDKALHKAQLGYLKDLKSYSAAHPYYWASFVMIGDTEAIFTNTNTNWYWGVLLGASLLIILFFVVRRKKEDY